MQFALDCCGAHGAEIYQTPIVNSGIAQVHIQPGQPAITCFAQGVYAKFLDVHESHKVSADRMAGVLYIWCRCQREVKSRNRLMR